VVRLVPAVIRILFPFGAAAEQGFSLLWSDSNEAHYADNLPFFAHNLIV